MPMDFPAFPAVGQEYTVGTVTYVYNGTGWVVKGSSSDQFVVKSGDTMTGFLNLHAPPDAPLKAATKSYVDQMDEAIVTTSNAQNASQDTQIGLKVNKSGDMMTGDLGISKVTPKLILDKPADGRAEIIGKKNGLNRWSILPGSGGAEVGGNTGSDFAVQRYADDGTLIGTVFSSNRVDGTLGIFARVATTDTTPSTSPTTGALTVAGGVGINGDLNVGGNITFKGVPAAPLDALAYNGMQINGGMAVSQENGANIVTAASGADKYVVDGWCISYAKAGATVSGQQGGGPGGGMGTLQIKAGTAFTAPTGGDYAVIRQKIEGFRVCRLGFGSSGAVPVTIGFWVYATVGGTMGVSLHNAAVNRNIVSNVTIAAANTWEWKTVTFPGDTTGTWEPANLIGLYIDFCVANGTSFVTASPNVWAAAFTLGTSAQTNFLTTVNNTVNIGGVVVLPGTQAPTAAQSPLIMRPYDQELVTCQRYYQKYVSYIVDTNIIGPIFIYPTAMRSAPTITGGGAGFTLAFSAATMAHFYQTARAYQDIVLDARL